MGTELRVKDLMRTQFQTVLPDATIHEAVEKLYSPADGGGAGIPGWQALIVQDADGKLVGMLTIFDIMEGIEPPYLRDAGGAHLAGITWEGLFEESVHKAENLAVREIMTPRKEFRVVSVDDRVMKALELMVDENTPRLPVCDGERVVGVIRMYEIFQEIAREILTKHQHGEQG